MYKSDKTWASEGGRNPMNNGEQSRMIATITFTLLRN